MTRSRRWWLAAGAMVLVIGAPFAARALPVGAPDLSARDVQARITAAAEHPYSGRVETVGNLDLPVTSRFTDVGELLGDRTSMRVWWRSADQWRVDKLLLAGETDLVHEDGLTTQWRYETTHAVHSVDPEVRLPRTSDLLPPSLAARVLEDVGSVRRIAARRVAGTAAPGIRVSPADARSSIDHVDLWADPDSGVVLRLDAYAVGDSVPAFSTRFTTFSADLPSADRIHFRAPRGAEESFDRVLDIADAANQYAPYVPPGRVAGLERAATPRGAVGVYGSGLTRLMVVPLRHRDADVLRDQVERGAGATRTDAGVSLQAGPLGVLVSGDDGPGWLVTGLVTGQTLLDAVDDLVAGAVPR